MKPRDSSAAAERPRVLVVGPAVGGSGGIAVVIESLLGSDLARRFALRHVSTHVDGGPLRKAVRGALGLGAIAWALATRRADLVYIHASSGFSMRRKTVAAELARLARRPYVVHVHGSHYDSWYLEATALEQRFVRRELRGAAYVIALSPTWERRLRSIAPCRTVSVPNPVSIPAETARLNSDDARILFLGRLGPRKGSGTLVEAFALLASRHPTATLVLAGDGDVAEAALDAGRLAVADKVATPGWIGPKEKERMLHESTVFALPARDEGLPVSLLEAMAHGLPSVVSPVGGIPDIFRDGVHGYLVPPDDPRALADALDQIVTDRDRSRQMGAAARREAIARFSVDIVGQQVSAVLEAALGARSLPEPAQGTGNE